MVATGPKILLQVSTSTSKDYTFCTENQFFTTKDAQSIVKIRLLVTFLHF